MTVHSPSLRQSRDEKLYREKVIGRVTECQHSSLHEIAKLSNLKQTNFKWHRGRKLGEWEGGRKGGVEGGREEEGRSGGRDVTR